MNQTGEPSNLLSDPRAEINFKSYTLVGRTNREKFLRVWAQHLVDPPHTPQYYLEAIIQAIGWDLDNHEPSRQASNIGDAVGALTQILDDPQHPNHKLLINRQTYLETIIDKISGQSAEAHPPIFRASEGQPPIVGDRAARDRPDGQTPTCS